MSVWISHVIPRVVLCESLLFCSFSGGALCLSETGEGIAPIYISHLAPPLCNLSWLLNITFPFVLKTLFCGARLIAPVTYYLGFFDPLHNHTTPSWVGYFRVFLPFFLVHLPALYISQLKFYKPTGVESSFGLNYKVVWWGIFRLIVLLRG